MVSLKGAVYSPPFFFHCALLVYGPTLLFSFFLSQQAVAGHHIPALLRSIDLHGVSALLPQLMLNAKLPGRSSIFAPSPLLNSFFFVTLICLNFGYNSTLGQFGVIRRILRWVFC